MSNYYQEAKFYLHQNYKEIMSVFGNVYAQLEAEAKNITPLQLASKCAYYTVISYEYLNGNSHLSFLEAFVKGNKESSFNLFDKELASRILLESRIHDLEILKYIQVVKDKEGNNKISLTELGKSHQKDFSEFLGT